MPESLQCFLFQFKHSRN